MTERRHASANVAPSSLAFPQPRLRLGSYPRGTLTELLITLTLPSPSRREIHAMGGAVELALGRHVGLGAPSVSLRIRTSGVLPTSSVTSWRFAWTLVSYLVVASSLHRPRRRSRPRG